MTEFLLLLGPLFGLLKRKHPTIEAAFGSVVNFSVKWSCVEVEPPDWSVLGAGTGATTGLEGCSVQFSGLFVEVRPNWK